MANDPQGESISNAIKSVRTLRANVAEMFSELSEGDSCYDKDSEKALLVRLQESLVELNGYMRDVEVAHEKLNPPNGPFQLGNTGYLCQDPLLEKGPLYTELLSYYKWTDKVHEYAGYASVMIGQNSIKRTAGISTKRRRTQPSSYNIPSQQVDTIIATIERLFQDVSIHVSRPFGSNAVVQITLSRILKAVVVFKGLMIEWVLVKGYHEDLQSEDGTIDLWSESRYQVFRKLTENANASMLHFYSPVIPELAIRSFMTWLHSFVSLFSDVCKKCGNHLNNNMPPTWREFRTLEPYHEDCKPSC